MARAGLNEPDNLDNVQRWKVVVELAFDVDDDATDRVLRHCRQYCQALERLIERRLLVGEWKREYEGVFNPSDEISPLRYRLMGPVMLDMRPVCPEFVEDGPWCWPTGMPVTKEVKTVIIDGKLTQRLQETVNVLRRVEQRAAELDAERQTRAMTATAALRDLEHAVVDSAYRYEEVADTPELLKRVCKLCDAREEVMTKLEPVRMLHSRACPLTHISGPSAAR